MASTQSLTAATTARDEIWPVVKWMAKRNTETKLAAVALWELIHHERDTGNDLISRWQGELAQCTPLDDPQAEFVRGLIVGLSRVDA